MAILVNLAKCMCACILLKLAFDYNFFKSLEIKQGTVCQEYVQFFFFFKYSYIVDCEIISWCKYNNKLGRCYNAYVGDDI